MNTHSTNYTNTFIAIAADCAVAYGEIPPIKGEGKTVANIQFDLLYENPYKFTSDDILFQVYVLRNDLSSLEYEDARQKFFSKGQPCFRASPLTKRYGWGVHCNQDGKIAIYGCESAEYQLLFQDKLLKVVKAMKSNK